MSNFRNESLREEFETAFRKGDHLRIEAFLQKTASHLRPALLTELLLIELWWRKEENEQPVAEDYTQRFEGYETAVAQAFQEFDLETIIGSDAPKQPHTKLGSMPVGQPAGVLREFDGEGRFEFKRLLGRGAFGVVWQVYDSRLKRNVALKIPHRERFDGASRERFQRESQAAARLNHDGIVSVYDICYVEHDLPVIVSQYIEGENLATLQSRESVFSGREAAALSADLADALEHAHSEGIVHRDLKPANILMDAIGKAYITDFGLAKDLSSKVDVTLSGDVLGTAAYMAPEQAAGESTQADGRCDIYALGVILYEMVTGERPFRGTVQMLLQQVVHDAPPAPQRLNANVHVDLQTIILQCLEKKPEHRYQTAADLRDDLLRYVNNEPILARPPTLIERFVKWYPPHATEMLGTYFIVAAMTWVFYIAGGLLEPPKPAGYQLASFVFLPWAFLWIGVGAMILKHGLWFEVVNVPLILGFICLPFWIQDDPQAIALICLIGFFGSILQVGAFVSRWKRDDSIVSIGLASRLSSG